MAFLKKTMFQSTFYDNGLLDVIGECEASLAMIYCDESSNGAGTYGEQTYMICYMFLHLGGIPFCSTLETFP